MSSTRILVVDSGLGGLSVAQAIHQQHPAISMTYCADYAAFPYGNWSQDKLQAHLMKQISGWIENSQPDAVVIACNTASTLILPGLRDRFKIPFVGTVPAIKPAAAITKTKMISILATPGTVARDYTHSLLKEFAKEVDVTLIGSPSLAGLVERWFLEGGSPLLRAAISDELAPCFKQTSNNARTDSVVLACTHFPLLKSLLQQLAPWPVHWLDPSKAIARQVGNVLGNISTARGSGTLNVLSSLTGSEDRVKTVWQKLSSQPGSRLTHQG